MTDIDFNPTYDDIHAACALAATKFKKSNVEINRIIGLSRGGLLPAVILSHLLDVPMTAVAYSSQQGNGDNKNHTNALPEIDESNILVVDDIIDSGYTMKEIINHYRLTGKTCHSYALFFKSSAAGVFIPTAAWKNIPMDNEKWVVFPFEQHDE